MFRQCHLKITSFKKASCPSISKSLHIYFNSSQNISPILLLNSLVMVTNKSQLLGNDSNKKCRGNIRYNLAYFVHI